ncbi:MAG: cytochrome c biogenesis heme-transporting ATPase CcmA [Burkholderiales bacterium]
MLTATNLECIRGNSRLFYGISLAVEPGHVLRIEGSNGSGKTSLMRMVCGLLQPARGEIRWGGQRIGEFGEDYRAQLAFLGHTNGVKDELSAIENLRVSARLAGDTISEEDACAALRQLGLAGREDLPAKVLSQGQKRRVALARFLSTRKPLWLLDEPVASLDSQAVEFLETMLEAHLARGGMALLTTHQPLCTPSGSTECLRLGS